MYSIIFQAIIDSERPKPNFVVGRTIKESSQKCTQSNFEESGTARAIFVVGQKIIIIMYSINFEKSERPKAIFVVGQTGKESSQKMYSVEF